MQYIVLCADTMEKHSRTNLERIDHYFKELSSTYHLSRFGTHRPLLQCGSSIRGNNRSGVVRGEISWSTKLEENLREWSDHSFGTFDDLCATAFDELEKSDLFQSLHESVKGGDASAALSKTNLVLYVVMPTNALCDRHRMRLFRILGKHLHRLELHAHVVKAHGDVEDGELIEKFKGEGVDVLGHDRHRTCHLSLVFDRYIVHWLTYDMVTWHHRRDGYLDTAVNIFERCAQLDSACTRSDQHTPLWGLNHFGRKGVAVETDPDYASNRVLHVAYGMVSFGKYLCVSATDTQASHLVAFYMPCDRGDLSDGLSMRSMERELLRRLLDQLCDRYETKNGEMKKYDALCITAFYQISKDELASWRDVLTKPSQSTATRVYAEMGIKSVMIMNVCFDRKQQWMKKELEAHTSASLISSMLCGCDRMIVWTPDHRERMSIHHDIPECVDQVGLWLHEAKPLHFVHIVQCLRCDGVERMKPSGVELAGRKIEKKWMRATEETLRKEIKQIYEGLMKKHTVCVVIKASLYECMDIESSKESGEIVGVMPKRKELMDRTKQMGKELYDLSWMNLRVESSSMRDAEDVLASYVDVLLAMRENKMTGLEEEMKTVIKNMSHRILIEKRSGLPYHVYVISLMMAFSRCLFYAG